MEKEFIPYEQTSSLIALGFNEPVIAHRQDGLDICLLKQPEVLLTDLSMILYQQAFRWFRENYDWTIKVNQVSKNNWSYTLSNFPNDKKYYGELCQTYEEAELACLTKLIEIVEQKNEN